MTMETQKKSTKILGMEFAPLSIPAERRKETVGALHYSCVFLFLGFGNLFFFIYLLFSSYYFIPLAYLVWYTYDISTCDRGGCRKSLLYDSALFRYHAKYFPLQLVKTAELHPSKNYIFGCHPHGIMGTSHFINFGTNGSGFRTIFPGIKSYLATLAGQYMFPVHRDYVLSAAIVSTSKESIEWILSKEGTGNAVSICLGGALEALEAKHDNFNLKLKNRKGFCRIALKHGASLVPVYTFGETSLFDQLDNRPGSSVRLVQDFITKYLGFSPPFFHGRGIFNYTLGLLPFRRPLNTVVGSPITVERVETPSREEVDDLHQRYCDALVALFEEHKLKYGHKDTDHLQLF